MEAGHPKRQCCSSLEDDQKSLRAFGVERKAEGEAVLARIAAEGPLAASDFAERGAGGWWGWSDRRRMFVSANRSPDAS